MKKQLLAIGILCLSYFSYAQNWAPVQVGETYSYTKGTLQFTGELFPLVPNDVQSMIDQPLGGLLNTVKNTVVVEVASTTQNTGETTFNYSPRLQACDTCSTWSIMELPLTHPDYWFPEITQMTNGNHRLIFKGDTIELAANPLTTNTTNASQQISTTVDSVYLGAWMYSSISDSMVSLTVRSTVTPFTPLYNFRLSKNYGITECSVYDTVNQAFQTALELIRKEGASSPAGWPTLGFGEIYDFNVGDQFFYNTYCFDAMGLGWTVDLFAEYQHKIRVLARQDVSPDTIIYTMERTGISGYNSLYVLGGTDTFTISYTNDPIAPFNLKEGLLSPTSQGNYRFAACKDFFFDPSLKYVGYDFGLTNQLPPNTPADNYISTFNFVSNSSPYPANISTVEDVSIVYKAGLGAVFDGEWFFERTKTVELIGYIKGTDTVGTILNVVLNTHQLATKEPLSIQVLSNPIQNQLQLKVKDLTVGNSIHLELVDLNGRVQASFKEQVVQDGTYTFPIQNVAAGMYILNARTPEGEQQAHKIIIQP